jgi:CheY-like chemotaxis protein
METTHAVLVVEDEAALQDAIKMKMEKEGMAYIGATNAEEALVKLTEIRPELIWLDLLMPGMGGFAFLQKLRETPSYRDIPVVIVSVSASAEKIRHAFELNVVDYLVKSQYKLEDIINKMKTFITQKPLKA